MMKNVLYIHQSAELYGSDKTLLIFLKNINKIEFFPVVVLPNEGPLKTELEKIGVKVIVTPVLKLYRDIFTFKNGFKFLKDMFISVSILNKLHKEHKFDIVYSNTLAVLLGAIFSKKKNIKHTWHVHEIIEHPKTIAWLFPKLLNYFSTKIICNSEATKKNIVTREIKNLNKTVVVHNGIQIEETTNVVKREDLGYTENDIIITLVGRISRLKGHNWLLQTFNEYFKNTNTIKLLFVGSPVPNQEYYLHDIEAYITSNNLSKSVKIIPFTLNLAGIWNITDIALMPSTEKESFGLVAAEAMMAKKPVIGSNHGGLMEVVVNNETGFLVEPNNKIALKEALEKLINNPELRTTFGEKGAQRATENFGIEKYVRKIEDILKNN
jgi:glycosyltransferase involved in cell wall biosynthesis